MGPIELFVESGRVVTLVGGAAPRVLIIHGYGGSAAEMLPLALGLSRAGLGSVSVDLPGHGDSDAFFTYEACKRVVAAELEALGAKAAIVGHSLGARLALLFPRPVVCLSPPLSLDFEGGRSRLLRLLRVRRVREVGPFAGLRDVLGGLPEVTFSLAPALVYHAADDLATVSDFARLAAAAGMETLRVEGANHLDIISAAGIGESIAAWIKKLA